MVTAAQYHVVISISLILLSDQRAALDYISLYKRSTWLHESVRLTTHRMCEMSLLPSPLRNRYQMRPFKGCKAAGQTRHGDPRPDPQSDIDPIR